MIEIDIVVKAVLVNPDELWEDTIPTKFPEGAEIPAMLKLLGSINATNGLLRFDETSIEFIPMMRIKSLNISLPRVSLANLGDLSKLTKQ